MLVEFPVLIAVAAEPKTAVIVPLIGEAHRDAVLAKRPDFLDQAVAEFPGSLASQERVDGLAACDRRSEEIRTTSGGKRTYGRWPRTGQSHFWILGRSTVSGAA
jgi:hypothetical protein